MGSMDGVADLVGRGLFAVVGGAVMWRIDPVLTLAAFAPVVVSSAVSDALGTRSAVHGAAARESTGRLTAFLGELVGANLAVRVAGAAPHVVRRLAEISETRRRLSLRDRVFAETVNSMNFHLVHVGTGAVLLLGAGKIRSGSFSVGDFALFVVFLDQLTYLPAEIGRVLTELKRTRVSIDRLHALMPGEPRDAVVAPRSDPRARPAAAACRRPRRPTAWSGSTSSASPASTRAARAAWSTCRCPSSGARSRSSPAASGAGRPRCCTPCSGCCPATRARSGGTARRSTTRRRSSSRPGPRSRPRCRACSARRCGPTCSSGAQPATRRVDAAVRAAVLEDDVAALDAGLDTIVGRRGVKLSGGQIQRAAAARMFLRDAELLVFDDLSSALDVATETELWRRLLARRGEVTCLVVSHSAIALANADRVVVLDDGRVVNP